MITLTRDELRRHASELIIALCICGGGYYFFVRPLEVDLAETRAQIVETQRRANEAKIDVQNAPQFEAAIDRAIRLADDVDARSRSARDEAAMFASLSQTAAEMGVLVDAIQPARQSNTQQPAPTTTPDGKPVPPPPDDITTTYTIELRGSYTNITRMLAILEDREAYSLVRRVQVQTISDPSEQLVRAVIKLDRLAFDTSALRDAVAGVGDEEVTQ